MDMYRIDQIGKQALHGWFLNIATIWRAALFNNYMKNQSRLIIVGVNIQVNIQVYICS